MRFWIATVALLLALAAAGLLGAEWHRRQGAASDLATAASEGDLSKVNSLLKAGAKVNSRTPYGYSPLHLAASDGQPEAVEALLKAGADCNARDDNGNTPLALTLSTAPARPQSAAATTRLLLGAGADVDIPNERGMSPKSWAASWRKRLRKDPGAVRKMYSNSKLADALGADAEVASLSSKEREEGMQKIIAEIEAKSTP